MEVVDTCPTSSDGEEEYVLSEEELGVLSEEELGVLSEEELGVLSEEELGEEILELSGNECTLSTVLPGSEVCCPFDCSDLATVSTSGGQTLSDDQKYQILTCKSATASKYPINKQKRRYQSKWAADYPWLRYSVSQDGVFCAPCFLFSSSVSHHSTEFVKVPFNDWKNATGTKRGAFKRHASSKVHLRCIEQATSFAAVIGYQ